MTIWVWIFLQRWCCSLQFCWIISIYLRPFEVLFRLDSQFIHDLIWFLVRPYELRFCGWGPVWFSRWRRSQNLQRYVSMGRIGSMPTIEGERVQEDRETNRYTLWTDRHRYRKSALVDWLVCHEPTCWFQDIFFTSSKFGEHVSPFVTSTVSSTFNLPRSRSSIVACPCIVSLVLVIL